jgi:hypothetical protein
MFTEIEKEKGLAIVRVFETGSARGRFDAVAVLKDGAGISYGIFQFTHRSGALCEVIEKYLENGGVAGREIFERRLLRLRSKGKRAIEQLSHDAELRAALIEAAHEDAMRSAQRSVADRRYLRPADEECEKRGIRTPLGFAVVLDGIVHGSYARFARAAKGKDEREWIADYLRRRQTWLASVPTLSATVYRPQFFLAEIRRGNWQLRLPLKVHGRVLRASDLAMDREAAGFPPNELPETTPNLPEQPAMSLPQDEPRPSILEAAEEAFDDLDTAITRIAVRTDRAKALWATIVGTIWQTLWALIGFLAGVPREIWIITAAAAAILTAMYLYRQIALGKLREKETQKR